MDHIFFLLGINEIVSYYGDGIPNRVFMPYNEFLSFLRKTFPKIINFEGLKKEFDSFQIIMLTQDGLWEVIRPEYKENPNQGKFSELVVLNQEKKDNKPINEILRNSAYMLHTHIFKKKNQLFKNKNINQKFRNRQW
jgi:hypothetical protein